MYTKLSIPERLKDLRVVDKHLTLEQLAEQTGLSKSALGKYESDDYKDISPFAIATLAKFYGVSTDYLMGVSENKNHPNTELQALHLSDAMVELLSSGKINNRLLCELATHPNFLRLMVDMEIFIDQIADMRVNQMNLILEATRQTILKEHAPGENDLYMRTLELGQVQENDFYSHILHDDLDSIVRDIREAHLKDKTTADPQPTLCFFYLGNDTIQTVLCLLIQIGKICPQLSRQKQFIVPVGTILLQIFPVHPSPPSDWAAFLRQL